MSLERDVEVRECAGKYCTVRFVPNRPEQQYCGRSCSFKALRYGRYRSRWHRSVEEYSYTPKYGRGDDDDA